MSVAGGAVTVMRPTELGRSLLVAFDAQPVHGVHVTDRETGTRDVIRLDPCLFAVQSKFIKMAALDRAGGDGLAGPWLSAVGVAGGTRVQSSEPLEVSDVAVVIEDIGY
jgi:hypothetical protein